MRLPCFLYQAAGAMVRMLGSSLGHLRSRILENPVGITHLFGLRTREPQMPVQSTCTKLAEAFCSGGW